MIGMKVSVVCIIGLNILLKVMIYLMVLMNILIFAQPGPDSIGIVAVSRNCSGVAARACGLVSLEPTKVLAL